jgi:selenocysteine-specific elongation factor
MAQVLQRNVTLGTAGHIDHGKTSLVKLLTGCDTDRLKEEKERGMSIELGFAPCVVAGLEIGIVDVPGHENFVKTMVAGATGIDGAILVIAADDGVMPQTREHLEILTLLGVAHGIVALTKPDCVTPERVEAAREEIQAYLAGTFLDGAPVVPVSSVTGQGFDEFYEALKDLVARIPSKKVDGLFRLPVERAFSAKGYGTIVAGIPACGSVGIGDEVTLLPQGKTGRVRAIQAYNRDNSKALAGQCAAINIPQWDPQEIRRGDVVTVAGYFSPELWYACDLMLLSREKSHLKNGTQVKFHTGTSETVATVYLFQETPLEPGHRCLIQVRLNDPVVAGPADHFILRSLSPVRTIGGGILVEAVPTRLKRNRPEVLADLQDRARAVRKQIDFIEYCVKSADALAADAKAVSLRTKIPLPQVVEVLAALASQGRIQAIDGRQFMHGDTGVQAQKRLAEAVGRFHAQQPASPGMHRDSLFAESGMAKEVFEALIGRMLGAGSLVDRKGLLALPGHREQFNDAERDLLARIENLYQKRPFNPPDPQEVVAETRAAEGQVARLLRLLTEQQRLIRVDQDLFFHADAVAEARTRLVAHIREQGGLESVKFKYLLDTTRKYAIPLLDYFDKIGVTRRVGYTRLLK